MVPPAGHGRHLGGRQPLGRRRSLGLVNTCWTAWVVVMIADRLPTAQYRPAETAEELRSVAGQTVFIDAVDIVAAMLAILVVLRLSRVQHEKALQRPGPGPGPLAGNIPSPMPDLPR